MYPGSHLQIRLALFAHVPGLDKVVSVDSRGLVVLGAVVRWVLQLFNAADCRSEGNVGQTSRCEAATRSHGRMGRSSL